MNITYKLQNEKYNELLSRIVTPYQYETNSLIQNEIESADRIFILGFSYADENMTVLNLKDSIKEDCRIYCCVYGLKDIEINAIRETYFTDSEILLGNQTMIQQDFCKNTGF